MTRDWARLGRALAEAREDAGLMQTEVAARLGVTRTPIQSIEYGRVKRISGTMRGYARLVGWTEESLEDVLAGGAPTMLPPAVTTGEAGAPPSAGLPVRIVDELSDAGRLVDTTVVQLPGRGRAVVVVKGEPDASPEELQATLDAWRRHLARLEEESE